MYYFIIIILLNQTYNHNCRISALVGTQVKLTATFAPSSSSSSSPEQSNEHNKSSNNINTSNFSQFNPKPPSPPKPTSPPQDPEETFSIISSPPSSSFNDEIFNSDHFSQPSSSYPPVNKNKRMNREHMPANMKRVSNERIFHGKSFDSRVEALKHLLTAHQYVIINFKSFIEK